MGAVRLGGCVVRGRDLPKRKREGKKPGNVTTGASSFVFSLLAKVPGGAPDLGVWGD